MGEKNANLNIPGGMEIKEPLFLRLCLNKNSASILILSNVFSSHLKHHNKKLRVPSVVVLIIPTLNTLKSKREGLNI